MRDATPTAGAAALRESGIRRSPWRSALLLGACLLGACIRAGSTDMPPAGHDVAPTSGLPPCSERLPLARAPRLDSGTPVERGLKVSFGAEDLLGVDENVTVLPSPDGGSGILRVLYPRGSVSFGSARRGRPLGGAAFRAPFGAGDVYCVHYRVRFPEGFAFAKGGKLPGLYGGDAPSGGDEVTGMNGWSVRLMWREDGAGELYEYIVNKDNAYGLSAGRGSFTFPPGRWIGVDLEVDVNEPGRNDGAARLWIDGVAVIEQTDIVYTTEGGRDGGGLMFSTFFGGHDDSWASPGDQHVDFADFRMHAPDAGQSRIQGARLRAGAGSGSGRP